MAGERAAEARPPGSASPKPNQVGEVVLYGVPIISLVIDGFERLCLAQISNTLLKNFSYNEIHNRRVALGITCVQCTPVQLELLRRAGAMPVSSRRCGMITRREAERLCKSFLGEHDPPKLPENFAFDVTHACAWGCRGSFIPTRYNSSRAKCIKCAFCNLFFSPNKFIFHSHRTTDAKYVQPDAANFNSWRRHLTLTDKNPSEELLCAWEDVKAMFNGGSRKRALVPRVVGEKCPQGVMGPQGKTIEAMIKRSRFGDDECVRLSGDPLRDYPSVPVPGKALGLAPAPPLPMYPGFHPMTPHGLCLKKDETPPLYGQGQNIFNVLCPTNKDSIFSPFYMLWHLQHVNGGLPLPKYPFSQLNKYTAYWINNMSAPGVSSELGLESDQESLTHAGSGTDSERSSSAQSRRDEDDDSRSIRGTRGGDPAGKARQHQGYFSAFRPVANDAESIAKLHGKESGPFGSFRDGMAPSDTLLGLSAAEGARAEERADGGYKWSYKERSPSSCGPRGTCDGQASGDHAGRSESTDANKVCGDKTGASGGGRGMGETYSGKIRFDPVSNISEEYKGLEYPPYFPNENLHTLLLHQMAVRRKIEQEFQSLKA
uniref:SKI family transcriptional corepressor 1 homolog-B-like n=1 Tax=Myxine glutinosa TaxID=7769 RepID=UPI00358F6D3F